MTTQCVNLPQPDILIFRLLKKSLIRYIEDISINVEPNPKDKIRYVIYYKNLRLYLDLENELVRIWRIIQFGLLQPLFKWC